MNEFEYHRNGVSGYPFWVTCDQNRLKVVFATNSDGDGPDPKAKAFKVSLASVYNAASFLVGPTVLHRIVKVNDRMGVVVFQDIHHHEAGVPVRTMVGVTDLVLEGCRTAVFDIGRLPDVRFGYNSWRGDNYDAPIFKWLGR